jgi:hypothetical protein
VPPCCHCKRMHCLMLHLGRNHSTTYEIDGANITGVFALDLTLAEVRPPCIGSPLAPSVHP